MTNVYVQQNCAVDILSQREELNSFAVAHGFKDLTWIEGNGKGKNSYSELMRLIKASATGDVFIVHEVTRICRALSKISDMMKLCQDRGIMLYSIREGYVFGDPITSKIVTYAFGMAVEAEKRIRSFRTREGLADRKASGAKIGRQFGTTTKLNMLDEKRQKIASLAESGDSVVEISHKVGVSQTTMYKYLRIHPELMSVRSRAH